MISNKGVHCQNYKNEFVSVGRNTKGLFLTGSGGATNSGGQNPTFTSACKIEFRLDYLMYFNVITCSLCNKNCEKTLCFNFENVELHELNCFKNSSKRIS